MAVGRNPFSSSPRLSLHISHKPLRTATLVETRPRVSVHRARAARRHVCSQVSAELAGGALPASAAASLRGSNGGFALLLPPRGSWGRVRSARRRGHGTTTSPVTAGSRAARALSSSPPGGLALLLAGPGLLLPLLALLLAAAARIMSGRRCAGGGAGAAAEAVEPAARELFEACRNGDVERVKRLVTPEKVNSRDTAGRKSTPLHFAAGNWDSAYQLTPDSTCAHGFVGSKPNIVLLCSGLSPWDSCPGLLAFVKCIIEIRVGARGRHATLTRMSFCGGGRDFVLYQQYLY